VARERATFASLVAAIAAFVALQAYLSGKLGVPKWTAWLAFIPPLLVFLWKTVPRLIEWRHERVFVESGQKDAAKSQNGSASAASYFLIRPYDEEDRGKYARADRMHVIVLDWLKKTDERILILTGSSGTPQEQPTPDHRADAAQNHLEIGKCIASASPALELYCITEGFPKPAGRIQQRCTRFFMLSITSER
jgi:hypothetical protein